MNIEEAITRAKEPECMFCSECGETLYSPMDKLSIGMYGKCPMHLQISQEENLFKIIETVF